MGTSTYLMDRPDASIDLSCMNISCGADVCICKNGEFTSESISADKTVTVNTGICALDVDPTRHQLPVGCVADVEDKCGCGPCSAASEGTGGEATGITAEEAEAIAQTVADDCVQAQIDALAAQK